MVYWLHDLQDCSMLDSGVEIFFFFFFFFGGGGGKGGGGLAMAQQAGSLRLCKALDTFTQPRPQSSPSP